MTSATLRIWKRLRKKAINTPHLISAHAALHALWQQHDLPIEPLDDIHLSGEEPALASSFAVASAAQASIAAAAAAALQFGSHRGGPRQQVSVNICRAAHECTGLFTLEGTTPPQWAPLSGLYRCRDRWIRLHANFDHHRDAALRVLGVAKPTNLEAARDALAAALTTRSAVDFEQDLIAAGGVGAVLNSFAEWDASPQAAALASLPLVEITRIGDADVAALPLPPLAARQRPLHGVRVLDLTRILAGPVCGRTLAAYGAEVMLLNSPGLPNIDAIIDTSRGKLSALLDLDLAAGRDDLARLLADTHVLVQAYRPGALAARGLGATDLAALRPGLIYASLSAYGRIGPLATRRGFDSLVQTASGFNDAEASAFSQTTPRALPVQILDYASGFLLAFGIQVALLKQHTIGGSWQVQVSLARTGHWLRSLGRLTNGTTAAALDARPFLQPFDCTYGALQAIPHAAEFSATPAGWQQPSAPPGSHPPRWP